MNTVRAGVRAPENPSTGGQREKPAVRPWCGGSALDWTHLSAIVRQPLLPDGQLGLLVEQLLDTLNRREGRQAVGPQSKVLVMHRHPWQPKNEAQQRS